jgi:flagellar hook-length control protein FliK
VSAPVLPALPEKSKVGSVVPTRSATALAAKSVAGKQAQQTAKAAAGGKIQGSAEGVGLPMPDASPTSEGAQAAPGDLTGDADSEKFPDIKSAGKPDAAAMAAKAGNGIAPQTKHLNSPVPTVVHPSQIAPAAVGGTGETAVHISALPQGLAGVSSPAVGALQGAGVAAASPYDRIDQGTAPVVLHAGAQQVAVGVHDPSLGWVEIKTQSAAGHVDATLVASSGQTRDALAAQLPAISQFLEQRDVRVGTLVVNHQSAGSGANHFGNGSGAQNAGQGYGGNAGSGGNSGNSGGERRGPQYSAPVPAPHSVPVTGIGGESSAPARPLSYISVRA